MRIALICLWTLLIGQKVFALELESDGKQKRLVELYTSESCSSCPPAERWLNTLKGAGTLWKDYVPVEFHVDYWNHLHWKDKYSRAEFSQRQRDYHRKIRGGVYTPQVIKNGVNQRGWRSQSLSSSPDQIREKGRLKSNIEIKQGKAKVSFIPNKDQKLSGSFKCNLAVMSGGIVTKVKDGENSGRTLSHEFVVRQFTQSKLKKTKSNYACHLNFSSAQLKQLKSSSVAIWISNEATGEVLQAIGNWIK